MTVSSTLSICTGKAPASHPESATCVCVCLFVGVGLCMCAQECNAVTGFPFEDVVSFRDPQQRGWWSPLLGQAKHFSRLGLTRLGRVRLGPTRLGPRLCPRRFGRILSHRPTDYGLRADHQPTGYGRQPVGRCRRPTPFALMRRWSA